MTTVSIIVAGDIGAQLTRQVIAHGRSAVPACRRRRLQAGSADAPATMRIEIRVTAIVV
jgi:hypothetical protein